MIGFGDELGERLMRVRASCRSCGRSFSFEEGGRCARSNAIGDQVVVCPHCFRCYELTLTPSSMTLLGDVTHRYPQLAAKRAPAAPAPSAVAAPAFALAGAAVEASAAPAFNDAIPAGAAPYVGPSPVSTAVLAARPGCVTAYAVLLFIAAALITLGGIALAGGGEAAGPESLLLFGIAGAEVAIGVGLWRMKNWARILLIVVQSLGIVSSLVALVGGGGSVGVLGGIAVNIYIISWFARNGRLFR